MPSQCASLNCVEAVCCDTTCAEPNHTCTLPGREGTCLPITAAPAPALTRWGLLAGAVALASVAALALRHRASYQ
jgi:hypothetical protein